MGSSREGGLCLERLTQKDEAWDLDQSPPQVPGEPTTGSPYFLRGSVTKRCCERGLWQPSLPPPHTQALTIPRQKHSAGLPVPLQQGHTA